MPSYVASWLTVNNELCHELSQNAGSRSDEMGGDHNHMALSLAIRMGNAKYPLETNAL
jgi:hypothetical protein